MAQIFTPTLNSFNKKSKTVSLEDGMSKCLAMIQAGEELLTSTTTNGFCCSVMEIQDGTTLSGHQAADGSSS
jgi:hypothetical protein